MLNSVLAGIRGSGFLAEFSRCKLKSDAKLGPIPVGSAPCAFRATAVCSSCASQGQQKTPLLPPPKARLFPEVMWGLEGNLVYQRCVGTSIILWRLRRAGDKTIDETHCEESPLVIVRVLFEPPCNVLKVNPRQTPDIPKHPPQIPNLESEQAIHEGGKPGPYNCQGPHKTPPEIDNRTEATSYTTARSPLSNQMEGFKG